MRLLPWGPWAQDGKVQQASSSPPACLSLLEAPKPLSHSHKACGCREVRCVGIPHYLCPSWRGGQVLPATALELGPCPPSPPRWHRAQRQVGDARVRALRSGCDSHLGGVCSGRHPMPYWFLCPRQTVSTPVAAGPAGWQAPSRCPEGDHLVDGLFSHGCDSLGDGGERVSGSQILLEFNSREGVVWSTRFVLPLPGSGTFCP